MICCVCNFNLTQIVYVLSVVCIENKMIEMNAFVLIVLVSMHFRNMVPLFVPYVLTYFTSSPTQS